MVIPERALAFGRWLGPGRVANVTRCSSFSLKNVKDNESGNVDTVIVDSLFMSNSSQIFQFVTGST